MYFFFNYGSPVCAKACLWPICVFCAFSLALFLLFVVLFYSDLFLFYYYSLDACLFSDRTQLRLLICMGGELGRVLEELVKGKL